jgi:Cu+-exporting ATPase
MKARILLVAVVAVALTWGILAAGCNPESQPPATGSVKPPEAAAPAAGQAAVYTCPMHPDVKSDKPGKCPKCGMALAPMKDAK